jgi:hypothetical protein
MKRNLLVLALVAVFFYAAGQESEVRSVGSFRAVKASQAIDVYLKKGDKESVKVVATGTSLSNVLTEVSGSYLKIHMLEGRYRSSNVKVYVTYVSLEKISASSASNIFSEGTIKATNLDLSASSAASIEVSVEAESVNVEASSAGEMVLEGKTRRLSVDVSSAGEVDAYNLESDEVRASASSAGSIKVNVVKEFIAHASSGGSVRFRGSPERTNINSTSGGSVKKSN